MTRGTFFRFAFCLAASLLSLALVLPAQPGNRYIVKQYSIANGLPQSSVSGLVLDRNGFLWIATQGGLCRFDGLRFRNYTTDNSMLPTDRITGLVMSTAGKVQVLVGTSRPHFFCVDDHYRLQWDQVFEGHNYIYTKGRGLMKCDSVLPCADESGKRRIFRLTQAKFIENDDFFPLNDHALYLYEKDTLLWVDVQRKQFRNCGSGLHMGPVVSGHQLAFNKEGHLVVWKGPEPVDQPQTTSGFKTLQERMRQYPLFWKIVSSQNPLSTTGLICIHDEVWGVRLHNGLWDAFLLYNGLDPLLKISICYDEHNKLLFIGTPTNGFYVVRESPFWTILPDEPNSLRNSVSVVLRTNTHTVIDWNYQFDPVKGTNKPLPVPLYGTPLFKSSDGRIWYAIRDTLYVADSSGIPLQKICLPPPTMWVRALLEDEDHTIWVCSDQALRYIRNNSLQSVALEPSFFSVDECTTLFSFDRERLWLGTTQGIFVYHKKTGKIENRYLEGKIIRSIYRARDGGIWVSTYGKGIYRYLSGKWVPLPLDAEQHLLFAHYFVEDDNGFFWIPTNNGLFQCKKQVLDAYARQPGTTPVYYYHHKQVGTYTDEFNGGYGQSFTWFDRLLLLPSLKGIVCFEPMAVQPLLPNKEILIEEIKVNDKMIDQLDHFTLPPGNQRLEIDVAAPYFGDAPNIVLEYQLREISERWLPLTTGTIAYNSLPRGDYHLTIRKRTGFGSYDYAYKNIHFTILPFWYETFWFWLAVVGGLAGILYLLIRRRIRALEKAKLRLEQKVSERTAELKSTVDELNLSEQQLSKVNMVQEQALAIILHDIRSPLNYLSVWARQFNQNIRQLPMEEIVAYSNALVLSTDSIDKFSNDLVQWLVFNRDNQKLNNETIDLPLLLQEIKSLYDEIVALGNNIIVVEEGAPVVVADRDKLYLVIRNLVDNAAKHCQEGQITLSAHLHKKDVVITVADTGKGMTEEALLWWQHYETTSPDFKKEKLGLSMVYYFVALMNGSVGIASIQGKGTTVTVTLPALPLSQGSNSPSGR